MSGPDWWQAQRLLEEQMFRKVMLEEECEHGIHKDSGHTCLECLVNGSDYEGLLRADPAYQEWLDEIDKTSTGTRT